MKMVNINVEMGMSELTAEEDAFYGLQAIIAEHEHGLMTLDNVQIHSVQRAMAANKS